MTHEQSTESELFLVINRGFAPATRERFSELIEKRDESIINNEEFQELVELTNQAEELHGQRLEAVISLAQLRDVPFEQLWRDLQLPKFNSER